MTGFTARARAVDMLGRQQIANLPTAISELFKNAHDAYATRVRADFFRVHNLLVVSDDGIGMDRESFEKSWLTIATESKLERSTVTKPRGMRERTQLGEKGIGRFAIAALGSQVLVVSKRKNSPTVAALVNWKMFELPHIDLGDVPVGLVELASGELTAADVARLKDPLVKAIAQFRALDSLEHWSRQLDEIESVLDTVPDDPYRAVPDLESIDVSGTMFLIFPVSEELPAEITNPGSKDASMLDRTLYGFTDAWLGKPTTADFAVDFVDHRRGGDVTSLLQPSDFFRAADFDRADHHMVGEFDDEGHFSGMIKVFDQPSADFEVKRRISRRPRCGPFSFEVGVVQGLASESRLDPDAFGDMFRKLRRVGGLYVYMDGIRVQPYGRPDVDYLEIEERRSRGAGYYFFSYRRMFGAVRLSSQANPDLQEKAGREGFTRGFAYSDFRSLLVHLLEYLAATYFRADGVEAGAYQKGRERLAREKKLRKERDRKVAAGRKRLRAQLAAAVQYLSETNFGALVSEILRTLEAELDDTDRLQPATRRIAEARRALRHLVEPLEFDEPEGFAPTGKMRQDMALVERGAADVAESYIQPALEAVDELATAVEERLAAHELDEQERREFVQSRLLGARNRINAAEREGRRALAELSDAVRSTLRHLRSDFETRLDAIAEPTASHSGGWIREQAEFERVVDSLTAESSTPLRRVARLVQASGLEFTGATPTPTDLAAVADAEIVELRYQADAQLELVQLGLALSVVDHEFQATVASIRSSVRRVGSWARKNPKLVGLYEDLRRDFDHLDSYLTLLTPMQRRVRRTKTTIKGSDISRFLGELFRERLRASDTEIRPSREFQAVKIVGYASTFYPVFINLVDNSLYWIQRVGPRRANFIELDTRGDALVVRDTGPGLAEDIADRVFDFGLTTKPGGRGLGLAIASQVLDRAGWSISLGECHDGAEFVIRERTAKP